MRGAVRVPFLSFYQVYLYLAQLSLKAVVGMYEINALFYRLINRREFDQEWIIRLHSSLTPEEQSRAFALPPFRERTSAAITKPTLADYIDVDSTIQEASPTEEGVLFNCLSGR